MAHAGSAHGITVDDMEIKGLLEEDEVNKPNMESHNNAYFSGPDERIRILKFAFELLQIETQCARAILRQEPDLVIIFRLWKASVDAAGKDGSLAGLGSATHLQLSCPVRQYVEKVPSLFISTLNKNKRKTPSRVFSS